MGSQITNTPIRSKQYNARGIITHRRTSKQCFRRPGGHLFVLFVDRGQFLRIYRSTDNGFSWHMFENDATTSTNLAAIDGYDSNGPHPSMIISEKYDKVLVLSPDNEGTPPDRDIEACTYTLSAMEAAADAGTFDATRGTATLATAVTQGAFNAAPSINEWYVGYVDGGQLNIRRYSPRTTSISTAVTLSETGLISHLAMCADSNGHVDFLIQDYTGTNNVLKHVRYTENTFGTIHTVATIGAQTTYDATSIDVALDGYGTLCAVWSKSNWAANTECDIYYAISTDLGVTWSVNQLARTSGHSFFTDSATGEVDGRTTVIGGSKGGFLFSYVEDLGTTPKTFIRQLTTSDGATYSLGDEKQIGAGTKASDAIVGLRFFLPIDSNLLDISDPGQVRIAFVVGEGDSQVQADIIPVDFRQELLSLSAFPSTLSSETGTWNRDVPDAAAISLSFNIMGGPNDNVDFYSLGKTGEYTTRYLKAFSDVGTNIRFLRFEPDAANFQNDSSGYGAPTETSSPVIFEPQSYAFPTPDLGTSDQTDFIEQDIRKIYLPPNKHLARTFVINEGGYLKRTVWLVEFGGNQYEVSQVVPWFMNNQLCYYEANAYVVGPSRDPFSRTILPSET